ncbi:MAG: stage III sporulation protein AG [Bacillota bacterium]
MEKKQGILEKVLALKGKKGLDTIIVIVIIAAIAFIYFTSFSTPSDSKEPAPSASAAKTQTADLEKRLAEVLSSIQGAGRVEVMVTYESGAQIVPAVNTKTQTDVEEKDDQNGNQTTSKSENTTSELVTVQNNGSSEAVVLREDQPQVRGVVVIAQGAGDVNVRMQLAQAVCTVLNVDQSSVDVFIMK